MAMYIIELDREDDYKALVNLAKERKAERDKEEFLQTITNEITSRLILVETKYGRDEAKRLIRTIHRDLRDSETPITMPF